MERIARQLLELFWGAVPSVLIVTFVYLFLRWAYWKPFASVLARREAATEGTRREADRLLAEAEEKVRQYEDSLRRARADIYRQQEAARQQALEERNRTLRATREKAGQMIRQAKTEIADDVAEAKKQLESEGRRLADQITRALLHSPGRRPPGGRP